MAKLKTISLKVTQASLNQTALDWPQNMANNFAAIDIAVAEGSDLVVMPELELTAYEVNDDFQRTDNTRIYDALSSIASYAYHKDPNLMVSVGNPWRLQLRAAFEGAAMADPDIVKNSLYDRLNLPFNVQTLIGGGRILGMTAKANLFRDERGYENRYFNEWSFRDVREYAELSGEKYKYGTIGIDLMNGESIPFGRPIIYVHDKNGRAYVHATAICEEKWVATQYDGFPHDNSRYEQMNIIPSISRYLGSKDGLLLEVSNASPPSYLKQDKHMRLNELASNYADVVIDTDGLGTSGATYAQFGHRLIAQNGKTISAGARMKFGQLATTTSVVKLKSANPTLEALSHASMTREFKAPSAKAKSALAWKDKKSDAAWDDSKNPDRWIEERIRNQALWMFDYMRKTKSKGIVEALSGGKDSSFNCAMVRVMVELAMHDLGVEGFCEQMSHLPHVDKILEANKRGGNEAAIEACMDDMLTAVYMGTNNSSYKTWYASKTLIDGGEFAESGERFKGIGGKFVERNVQDLVDFYAYVFAVSDTTKVPREKKLEVMTELAEFLNASPDDYTSEGIKEWEARIFKKYPEVDRLVSTAKSGHGIAYENIQARSREVLIMLFANLERKLPVANPNLDEAYGAYATFGGDLHSGTVNWNAGLHKIDQVSLMEYMEEKGINNVMDRIVSIFAANNNKPSAELQQKKNGEVTQFDEDALQGTFEQKAVLARLRHHTKIHTNDGDRWMNAGEIFDHARADNQFDILDDNKLFNSVAYFYKRWEGPAQHKIYATPIAPTFGENVDKQTSLRTPNLSGDSLDEITQLGIDVMFKWAREDGLDWSEERHQFLRKRAWLDTEFPKAFLAQAANHDSGMTNMDYNLRSLYEQLRDKGWDTVFTPLPSQHPMNYPQKLKL